jgi:multiple antibiotic resistance protein
MNDLFEFALLAFTSLFTMINPLGVVPVYISLTSKLTPAEAKKVAYKSILTALVVLLIFAVTGKFIFDFFAISVNSLKVVGGVIFFMTGYDMLQARLIRTKESSESDVEYSNDISITPLGIPLICGPGAITVSIVMMNEASFLAEKAVLLIIIVLVLSIALVFLLSARKIMHALGNNGNKVLMRIMGLIVMVIAVEFLFSGLKPLVKNLLN